MAIKVRCKNCRKKISIDEAFAGGVCRCPYCGALNMAGGSAATGGESDRPGRLARPDAPGAAEVEVAAEAREHIPTANPVRVQGIVAIVAIALLLLMSAAAGVWAYKHFQSNRIPDEPVNPFAGDGPGVVDVKIALPVVYVLDASSGTGDFFDSGLAVVRHSILTLSGDEKFQMLLVREEGIGKPGDDWLGGGKDGDKTVKAFVGGKIGRGATDLVAAVEQAIALKPKTIVLVAGKGPSADEEVVADLAGKASAAGVVIHCVGLGDYPDVAEPMQALSEKTGGRCLIYSEAVLAEQLRLAPELP